MASGKVEVKKKPLDPEVKFVLKIRVYGEGHRTHDSHGYLLDDMPMGVSAPVTEMVVNIRDLSLNQLRPMLMYDNRNGMKKRSAVWQEVLFVMDRMPNVYNRPKLEMKQFQFGFVRKSRLQDITLITPEAEMRPIADLIGATEYFNHDLVIVPWTQIPDPNPPPSASDVETQPVVEEKVEAVEESQERAQSPTATGEKKKRKKRKKVVVPA